jgi:hypothetical protein
MTDSYNLLYTTFGLSPAIKTIEVAAVVTRLAYASIVEPRRFEMNEALLNVA